MLAIPIAVQITCPRDSLQTAAAVYQSRLSSQSCQVAARIVARRWSSVHLNVRQSCWPEAGGIYGARCVMARLASYRFPAAECRTLVTKPCSWFSRPDY